MKTLEKLALCVAAVCALLSLAGRFDNRPGRLYSFVCYKSAS